LLDKYVDLSTNEQIVKNSIDYITNIHYETQQIKSNEEQLQRDQEQHAIETRYNEEHPKIMGDFNPEFVGKATS
jgi:pyridoxal/pyridoxine/pyridoxamine kinase